MSACSALTCLIALSCNKRVNIIPTTTHILSARLQKSVIRKSYCAMCTREKCVWKGGFGCTSVCTALSHAACRPVRAASRSAINTVDGVRLLCPSSKILHAHETSLWCAEATQSIRESTCLLLSCSYVRDTVLQSALNSAITRTLHWIPDSPLYVGSFYAELERQRKRRMPGIHVIATSDQGGYFSYVR